MSRLPSRRREIDQEDREAMLAVLQSLDCFHGDDVCGVLPCACVDRLVRVLFDFTDEQIAREYERRFGVATKASYIRK